ncbi:MAG: class I SAM-dependent methyltransferase [Acidobacteriota bacterium]
MPRIAMQWGATRRSAVRWGAAAVLLASLAVCPALEAQARHPVSGRRIAGVMGVGGADWLVRPERVSEENPEKAVRMLQLKPGMVVADVGAGVGYYSAKLAVEIGPQGKVYATDIQPGMIRLMRENLAKWKLTNVEPVLSTESSTGLPDGAIDLMILVDVYHEFAEPQKMIAGLKRALKADGRLVLFEYRKEDPKIPIREEHKMSVAEAKAELEADGMVLDKVLEDLPWQHMLFFRKVEGGK